MLTAVLYSLVGMIAFGIATAVGKTLVIRHGAVVSTVRREFFSILTLVLLVLIVGIPETISWSMVALGVLIAGLSYGGPFFQMYALQKNDVGVVIPITSFRIVVMSAVGVLFLGEALTLVKSATLAFVLLGVLVATINLRALRESELLHWGSGVPAALLASVIWGITMPFFMVPTVVLGAIFYALIIGTHAYVCTWRARRHVFKKYSPGNGCGHWARDWYDVFKPRTRYRRNHYHLGNQWGERWRVGICGCVVVWRTIAIPPIYWRGCNTLWHTLATPIFVITRS